MGGIEIAETHVGRSHSAVYNVCSADLTVPVLHGAIIEGVATLICRLGSRLVLLKNLSMRLPLTASSRPRWCVLPSRPAGVTSTPSSPPPSSSDAGATPPWSTLLCTGWAQVLVPSPLSRSGLTLKKLFQ